MATLECVKEMGDRRIFWRNGNLHPALSHHTIGVSKSQLRGKNHLRAGTVGMQRCRTPSTAAADDQNIRCVVWGQINILSD